VAHQTFIADVVRAWARLDADAALAYLKSLDRSTQAGLFSPLAAELARLRPRDLLALDGTAGLSLSQPLRLSALQALASEDLDLAVRTAEALPAGGQRETALAAIARSYGARDADAALAWARASGEQARVVAVLQGVAQRDPVRALDIALALESPTLQMQSVQSIVLGARGTLAENALTLADRLATLPDSGVRNNALSQVLAAWSATAPDAAVDWLATHDVAAQGAYRSVAQQVASNAPARAAELTARIPVAGRTEWIQGVAQAYAQSDPQGAAGWIAQYRGEPAYSAAIGSIAAGLAATDPSGAARLLATASDRNAALPAVFRIATQWGQRDPQTAAAWALDYDTGADRPIAIPPVVSAWARTDAAAARSWTLRLPEGAKRDAALTALLTAIPTAALDRTLLDGLSNGQTRNQVVTSIAMRLAGRDRAAAAQLVDTYITDENLREQVKRNLDRVPQGMVFDPFGAPIPPTGVR
jgi:hypothetical protein